jgi:hypothetical protein
MGRWIFPALPLTRSAEIFLLPVRRMTIVYRRIASAVGTMNRDHYHLTFRLSHISSSYSLTSFLFGHYRFLEHTCFSIKTPYDFNYWKLLCLSSGFRGTRGFRSKRTITNV